MTRIRVTEYLDLELDDERWHCRVCDHDLGSARENYKHACQVNQRDPREIHQPLIEAEYTFAPDPDWVRIVEFHCPGCFTQIETEYLPPGHPITHDIEIDLDRLRERLDAGELEIRDERLAGAMNTIDVDVGGTFTDMVLTLDGDDQLPQGADDAVRPERRLHAGRRGGGRRGGPVARGPGGPGRDRPLLDHGRDEPAARAQRPAGRADHHRGPRGRDADRQGRAVDRRHAPRRAARAAAPCTSRARSSRAS